MNNTLHVLTCSPTQKTYILEDIQRVWNNGDVLLLLADAAQSITHPILDTFAKQKRIETEKTDPFIFILETDAPLLVLPPSLPSYANIIGIDDWSHLIQVYERSLTWA